MIWDICRRHTASLSCLVAIINRGTRPKTKGEAAYANDHGVGDVLSGRKTYRTFGNGTIW